MSKFDDKSKYNDYGSKIGKRNNEAINATNADFRMIVGRRSNGKTYPTLVFDGIKNFIDSNYTEAFAYVRRWSNDLPTNCPELFNGCINDGWLDWYTSGKYNSIHYYRRYWYLQRVNKETGEVEERNKVPMAYAFAINQAEKYKGPDYPMIKRIVYDEFIPEKGSLGYINGEWRLWKSLLSTIIRERDDVIVYMIANSISKNCPYFDAYHIDIDTIDKGSITTFKYHGGGKLAIEYCDDSGQTSPQSSKYFEIDDDMDTGSMITRGEWETDAYPKLPRRLSYVNRTVMTFYIAAQRNKIITGHIIETDGVACVFFHRKTTPLQYRNDDYIYTSEWDPEHMDNPLIRVGFDNRRNVDRLILEMITHNRAYYDCNDTGEKVKYYMQNTR